MKYLTNKIVNAIYEGIRLGFSLDDFDDTDDKLPTLKKDIKSKSTFCDIAPLAQLKYNGIYIICNYEFNCTSFDTIDFSEGQKNYYNSNLSDEGYLEIHYKNGMLNNIHLNFAKATSYYDWKIYKGEEEIDQFAKKYPKCIDVINRMNPTSIYISKDNTLAILDNRQYITIMPTFANIFPTDLKDQYDFNFSAKDYMIRSLKNIKLRTKDLITKYHLVPSIDENGNLQFTLSGPRCFMKYFNINELKDVLLMNKYVYFDEANDENHFKVISDINEELEITINVNKDNSNFLNDTFNCSIKLNLNK